jgi:ubiquinone/menaquinone biosynthesis C-methylase UbiE
MTAARCSPTAAREARFWDRLSKGYARKAVGDPAAYETKLTIMRDLLDAVPDAQAVEVGCGTGTTALTLAPHAARIRAADLSPAMIAIAQEKAQAAGVTNVKFDAVGLEALDVAPGSQDMVMAHSILHLVADRDAAVARAHRWLKPNGVFVSSTPCLAEQAPWLRPVAWLAGALGVFPATLRFFGEDALRATIENHGFAVERRFRPGPKAAVFLVARKRP